MIIVINHYALLSIAMLSWCVDVNYCWLPLFSGRQPPRTPAYHDNPTCHGRRLSWLPAATAVGLHRMATPRPLLARIAVPQCRRQPPPPPPPATEKACNNSSATARHGHCPPRPPSTTASARLGWGEELHTARPPARKVLIIIINCYKILSVIMYLC